MSTRGGRTDSGPSSVTINGSLQACALHPGISQRILYTLMSLPGALLWGAVLFLLWLVIREARRDGPSTVQAAVACAGSGGSSSQAARPPPQGAPRRDTPPARDDAHRAVGAGGCHGRQPVHTQERPGAGDPVHHPGAAVRGAALPARRPPQLRATRSTPHWRRSPCPPASQPHPASISHATAGTVSRSLTAAPPRGPRAAGAAGAHITHSCAPTSALTHQPRSPPELTADDGSPASSS